VRTPRRPGLTPAKGVHGVKSFLAIGVSAVAALCLFWLPGSPASASTLPQCLAQHHVCVAGDGRHAVSQSEQNKLEQQIGGDDIYLVIAPAGRSGYDSAMRQIIDDLNGHAQFTVGFLDTRRLHFGADNKGMLPTHGAADIATKVVRQHASDRNLPAALEDFVTDVQREATSGTSPTVAGGSSHLVRNLLITLAVVVLLGLLGFFAIGRPIRNRRRRDLAQLNEAKSAAQDDLIALSSAITDSDTNVAIQRNPEAAAEQAAALAAYERGTAALDAARRSSDMMAVSRAIAEGQYRLASAEALAAGRPRPERRPSCFFDPRHGMSVSDAYWTPPDGGLGREVPVCAMDAHKLERGIEPEMRKVEVNGTPVNYVNAGFAPSYWGGFGFGPGLFTGFLIGEALAPGGLFGGPGYYGDGGDYGADSGGDYDGGDFGGGDFSGGDDFGGGDFGGGDFGGGDF
jgi:uncharacterized membrane protein YgcG